MRQPKVIVSVINDLSTDQRVHKVCMFLLNQGYEVLLVGRRKRDSQPMQQRSYATHRMRLYFEKGALFYAFFNLRLFFFLLFRKSDVLLSNDLDTLLPNFLIARLKRKRLVYDSHEYFTEVPELIHRPRIRNVWLKIERLTLPGLQTAYTVNQSIADRYKERYGISMHVVRNVAPLWKPQTVPSKRELGIPENCFLLIIQGAGLNVDRGIEEAITMMHHLNDTALLIVGDGDIIPEMKQLTAREGLSEKVLFFGKRPYAELMCFTFHADLGLSLDQPTNPNYAFSLPNKVFDYLHACTPIVCSPVVEVASLIRKHDIGIVLECFDPEYMAEKIGMLLRDVEKRALLETHCRQAALTENWENESEVLARIYPRVHE